MGTMKSPRNASINSFNASTISSLLILIIGVIAGRMSHEFTNSYSSRTNCNVVSTGESKDRNDDDGGISSLSSSSRKINFDGHYSILEDIIKPGRGYIPAPERVSTWLKEVSGSYWWLNETVPESFRIAKLDNTYPTEYFAGGHPAGNPETYTKYVLQVCQLFMPHKREVKSLAEFGNGGGYFSAVFVQKLGNDPTKFITVEGAGAGVAEAIQTWNISTEQVVQHDLRLPLYLGQRYDVAACTEVVEHVEPPFASQIIVTLVTHSDVIWFSYAPDSPGKRAWINHPNERPYKMWKNLFDFYGYDIVNIPSKLSNAVHTRGDFVAYRRSNTELSKVTTADINAILPPDLYDPNIV